MIKVRNINGAPETTPKGNFAIHSDEDFFYFFSSEADRTAFFIEVGIVSEEKSLSDSDGSQ
jgi:hypothetical protein